MSENKSEIPQSKDALEASRESLGAVRKDLDEDNSQRALVQNHLDNEQQNRVLRKEYAAKAYSFLRIYAAGCLFILILQGFSHARNGQIQVTTYVKMHPCVWILTSWDNFLLGDSVLLALVGSTAVSVLGLVGMILVGLFPQSKKKN